MPIRNITEEILLSPDGQTTELRLESPSTVYRLYTDKLDSGAILLAGIVVKQKNSDLADTPLGTTYVFKYEAILTYNGSGTIVVFGRELTEVEAKKESWITSTLALDENQNLTWITDIEYDLSNSQCITQDKLDTDSIYAEDADLEAGIDNNKLITPLRLQTWLLGIVKNTSASKFVVTDADNILIDYAFYDFKTKEISFEVDEQGDNKLVIPFNFKVISIIHTVTKTIAASDDGTITAKINGTAITDGEATIPQDSVVDDVVTATPTALFTGSAGDTLSLVAAKVTEGGKVFTQINLQRIP